VSLWLVKGPSASDVAGAALENTLGAVVGTAAIDLRATPSVGFDLSFATLPADLNALSLTLTAVRAPTTCPTTPATIDVSATSSQVSTPQTATSPLPVTGCSSLAYTPQVAAAVSQDDNGAGATFIATVTGSATESATQAFEIDPPASISPNVKAALGCLLGTSCAIGIVSAVSPLLPSSALSDGTLELGGSVVAPTLSLTFPPPYAISLTGTINVSTEALTFNGIPDLPLTSLTVDVGGGSSTQLFTTNCAASSLTTKLTPWDGASQQTIATPITFGGTCPPGTPTGPTPPAATNQPTVSGASLHGVVGRTAKLAFTVREGQAGKPIRRIAISLPKGLSFSGERANLTEGVVVRGARARKAKFTTAVKHGVMTITLSSAAASATITIVRPAITVSSALAKTVKTELEKKRVSALKFKLTLTDSGRTATAISLDLKPKS
jgi:hypothetical protein